MKTQNYKGGRNFFYFLTIKGGRGFLDLLFSCYSELMPYYLSAFSIWASKHHCVMFLLGLLQSGTVKTVPYRILRRML